MNFNKYRIDEITINLDNLRKPLNNEQRKQISHKKLYPYYGANNIMDYIDEYIFDEEIICIAEDGGSWGFGEKCSYIVNEKCWVNNHAHVLKAKDHNLNLKYLNYYLNYHDLNSKITGTTRGKLTKSALSSIEIMLPNREKQDAIVNTLDKAQELIDKRKEQIEQLDELVKSRFIEMFGDPVKNPMNWEKMNIGSKFQVKTGATPSRKEKTFWENGNIPWVKTTELKELLINETEEYITKEGFDNSSVNLLPKDTVLIAMYGQGKTRGMTGKLGIEATTNQACASILPSSEENMDFIWHQLIHLYEDLRNLGRGGNQPNLNTNLIKSYELIFPPIELQNQFTDFVNQINKLKFEMEESLRELEDNFNSLMQKAFKGELF